jgi:hypothetical protein
MLLPGLATLLLAALFSQNEEVVLAMLLSGLALMTAAYSFRSLRVVDNGQSLALRFGPLPLFRKRIRYADIRSAEPDRTTVCDGWGIHWVPGRGWTYNLWGFDCIRLTLAGGRTIRIGTDEPDELAAFLNRKLAMHHHQPDAAG